MTVRTLNGARDHFVRAISFVRDAWGAFVDWFNALQLSESAVLLAFGLATGVLAALGVVLFYKSIDAAFTVFYRWPAPYVPRITFLFYRPIVTAAGLLIAWWIMQKLGRAYEGMNVPDVQLAVVRRGGDLPTRPALARTAASAVTIGAGGSAGSEGPVVVLGAALASWLGRTFRFAPDRVTVLVACGSGAAISAAFNAPLAGAFFALEEIAGTLTGASFPPVVVASVIAAVVSRSVFGNHPAFPIPHQYGSVSVAELLVGYPLLGIVAGAMSALYVRAYFGAGALERKLPVPRWVVPLIGGVVIGAIVFLSNGRLVGFGHLAVQVDVFGQMAWYVLLALALGKIFVTVTTLNFGGSGGVFTPSLFIGAATGGAVGVALSHLFPAVGINPAVYALVGMGTLIAGATAAPITGILLVFEMTNDYALVAPLMVAVVICNIVARWLEKDSLYSGWLRRRGESIEHGADRDVLAELHVVDAYEPHPVIIDEDTPVEELVPLLARSEQAYFPVVSEDGIVTGVITIADIGQIAAGRFGLDSLLLAADVVRPSETVLASDSLLEAIRKMGVRGVAALPVTDHLGRLRGLISRSHVLSAYDAGVARSNALHGERGSIAADRSTPEPVG
jgi:CIC family chloride channel protein